MRQQPISTMYYRIINLMDACVTHGEWCMPCPAATDGVLNNTLPTHTRVPQNNMLSRAVAVTNTWDDGAFNAQSPAVLGELDELLHIIKQLSDDNLRSSLHLQSRAENGRLVHSNRIGCSPCIQSPILGTSYRLHADTCL